MADLCNVNNSNPRQIGKVVGDMYKGNKMKDVEKPFQCTECDLVFTTNAARNIHAKSHKVSQTYVCKSCNFKTNKFLALRKHRLDECGVQTHICHKCASSFPSTDLLKAHMRKHNKEHQCEDCDFTSLSKGGLTRHRSKKHPEFACAVCDYTCGCKNQMKKHIGENHISEIDDSSSLDDPQDDVFTCPICEYLDSDPTNMEKHIQEIHEIDKPFPCTECDQDFYDDVELELHIMTEHEVFSCSQCDYKGSIDDFETHMKTHSTYVKSTDILSCTLCDFTSTFDDDLEDHIYEFHTKGVGHKNILSEFELENSDQISKRGRKIKPKKWFDEYDNVKRDNIVGEFNNESTVSKDQLFIRQGIDCKCPICGDFFVNKQGLNNHMNRKHENYECEECNKIFKTASGIKNHIDNEHSSTQIISCAKCDYTCSTETDLRKHISVHRPAEGPNIHTDTPDSDMLVDRESIQDPGSFITENNVCGVEIEDDTDLVENMEYEVDLTSPEDSLCIDNNMNVDDNNISDCTEHAEVLDKSSSIIGDVSKINSEENNSLKESRKNCVFEKLFHNKREISCQLENKILDGKLKIECQNDNEITDPEVSVGQSNDYVEDDDDDDDEDDLGVEGDYIGDMYEDEERAVDDNILNEGTEYNHSVLKQEYTKGEEFDNIRTPVNNIRDITKKVSADNAYDVEVTGTHKKVKDLESVPIMEENDRNPNVKSDVLGFDFDSDDALELAEMNMACPSRYIDETYLEKTKKRKADECLEKSDIKKVTESNEDKEKIVIDADNDMDVWYGCSECDYVGPKQEFHDHIRKHGENKHFSCKICEYRCFSKKELSAHITKNHKTVGHFECTECDFTSTSTTGIKIHRRIHVRSEFLCGYCKQECLSIAALKEHHKYNHKGPVKVIKHSKDNINKRNRKLNPKYESEEFHSPIKESYEKNNKKESGEAIIISQKLSRRKIVAIPYKAGIPKLETYMNVNSNEEDESSVSKLDGRNEKKTKRKFVAMPKVQNAMRPEYSNESVAAGSKTNERKYQCKYCVFIAINRRGLSVHMTGMHGLSNDKVQYPKNTWVDTKQYACELCNFKASSNDKIIQHFRTHIGERPWTCQECGAKFTTKSARKIHEACHLEEKPFKCKHDGCKYATALKLNLASHYYIHTFKEKKARKKKLLST